MNGFYVTVVMGAFVFALVCAAFGFHCGMSKGFNKGFYFGADKMGRAIQKAFVYAGMNEILVKVLDEFGEKAADDVCERPRIGKEVKA